MGLKCSQLAVYISLTMNKLLTAAQVAEYLRMKPTTVRRKAARGEIPSIKVGHRLRFDKQRIDKWLLQQSRGRQVHILVIDDDPMNRQVIRDSLKGKSGYQVTTTISSLEALELVDRQRFDLIFLDLVMPEIGSSELFRRIREMDSQVPIAIITSYPDSDLLKKVRKHGPFLIVVKPFTIDDILQTVRILDQRL